MEFRSFCEHGMRFRLEVYPAATSILGMATCDRLPVFLHYMFAMISPEGPAFLVEI